MLRRMEASLREGQCRVSAGEILQIAEQKKQVDPETWAKVLSLSLSLSLSLFSLSYTYTLSVSLSLCLSVSLRLRLTLGRS